MKTYLKIKSFLFTLSLVLIYSGLHASNQIDSLFEKANSAYAEKDYDQAVFLYDSVENLGYEASTLYFNKGNAWFKLKNYPKAILNYEKAKKLAPNDEDIDANLAIVNSFIIDKIEPIPELWFFKVWYKLVNFFNARQWTFISVALVWLFAFSLFYFIIVKKNRNISFWVMLFFLFLSISSTYLAYKRHHFQVVHSTAVIMSPSQKILSAPDTESTELFIIHEGLKVELKEQYNDWYKIRLSDGKTGWVKAESLEKI